MGAVPSLHPTDQALYDFGLGKLDARSAESVVDHLQHCPDCRRGRGGLPADSVLGRVRREIRAVAKLRHPNIVAAYSAARLGEGIIFAMEYVDGLDLSKLVKAKGPLPVSHACLFAHQAALGLQHAHEEGLVHRDI